MAKPLAFDGNGKAIKGAEYYLKRQLTAGTAADNLRFHLSKRGYDVDLRKGDVFYIRPAGTAFGKYRVVLPRYGAYPFTLEGDDAERFFKHSKDV